MNPIDEQCFAFVICVYQKKAGDWLRRHPQSSVYATLLQELNRNEYKNYQRWFFRISRQMSMCICLHLPVLILSVDSDWLIPIKVGQSLTGNRNYFYLRQSWSNFDQVRHSGVNTIKVSNQSPSKWNRSNFDQVNFDSVNRLSYHCDLIFLGTGLLDLAEWSPDDSFFQSFLVINLDVL